MALGADQVRGDGNGLLQSGGPVAAAIGVVVQGMGVKAAFSARNGSERVHMHRGRAACRELGKKSK